MLRKNLARSIRRGHPWIYRDALARRRARRRGPGVRRDAPIGQPLARGFWDARSPIAVRDPRGRRRRGAPGGRASPPTELVGERVRAAIGRRLDFIDRRHTDAFRWIHGEADAPAGRSTSTSTAPR